MSDELGTFGEIGGAAGKKCHLKVSEMVKLKAKVYRIV